MTALDHRPTDHAEPPVVVGEVAVRRALRLSPSFVRVELGGDCLADLGVDGPWLDQRIKLVLPGPSGAPPDLSSAGADWWPAYCALPEVERGSMRTYTVRDVVGEGADRRLVVDIAVHEPGPEGAGSGPGNDWARSAAPGDRVLVVAPRRGRAFGGREFDPGEARVLVVAADETAVPAAAGILRDLPPDACGAALLEVPLTADVQDLEAPAGMRVTWLPRHGADRGQRLHAALAEELDLAPAPVAAVGEGGVDPDLWETPAQRAGSDGTYVWIAGEAGVVTRLRRHLVRGHGMDRRQVAFMGYWRDGVAMRG